MSALDGSEPPIGITRHITSTFNQHVKSSDFPCPIGQSLARNGALTIGVYDRLGCPTAAAHLYSDIQKWLDLPYPGEFRSIVALFKETPDQTLQGYHDALWKCLTHLSDLDPETRHIPPGVSDSIHDKDFAFCLQDRAFFVVGFTPHSPRYAHRFAYSGFALNLHTQFENLRNLGRMEQVKSVARKRDLALQGTVNPLLTDHGQASAALQFSTLPVTRAEQCPFHPRTRSTDKTDLA